MIAAATDDALCLLQFSDAATVEQRIDELARQCAGTLRAGSKAILDELWRQPEQYFRGERGQSRLPF